MSEKKFTPAQYKREAMAQDEMTQHNFAYADNPAPEEEDLLSHELLPPPEEREFAQELLERKRAEALVFERFREYFAQTTLNMTARALWDEYREGVPALLNELKREAGVEAVGVLEKLAETYQHKSMDIAEFADRAYEAYSQQKDGSNGFDLRDYDHCVFTELFAAEPQGDVYVEFLPTSVYIECSDLRDYQTAYQYGEDLDDQQSSALVVSAEMTGGFQEYLPDAKVNVATRNMQHAEPEKLYWFQDTKRHEDAHALDDEIFDLSKKAPAIFTEAAREPLFSGANQEIERELPRIMEQYAERARWRAIDEILAYMRTGQCSGKEIKAILAQPTGKGGLYDYYHEPPFDYETIILKPIYENPQATLSPKIAETVVRAMDKAKRSHQAAIGRLVGLAERIGTDANISHEELYAWLAIEAYKSATAFEVETRWKKLADAARVGYITSLAEKRAA